MCEDRAGARTLRHLPGLGSPSAVAERRREDERRRRGEPRGGEVRERRRVRKRRPDDQDLAALILRAGMDLGFHSISCIWNHGLGVADRWCMMFVASQDFPVSSIACHMLCPWSTYSSLTLSCVPTSVAGGLIQSRLAIAQHVLLFDHVRSIPLNSLMYVY